MAPTRRRRSGDPVGDGRGVVVPPKRPGGLHPPPSHSGSLSDPQAEKCTTPGHRVRPHRPAADTVPDETTICKFRHLLEPHRSRRACSTRKLQAGCRARLGDGPTRMPRAIRDAAEGRPGRGARRGPRVHSLPDGARPSGRTSLHGDKANKAEDTLLGRGAGPGAAGRHVHRRSTSAALKALHREVRRPRGRVRHAEERESTSCLFSAPPAPAAGIGTIFGAPGKSSWLPSSTGGRAHTRAASTTRTGNRASRSLAGR